MSRSRRRRLGLGREAFLIRSQTSACKNARKPQPTTRSRLSSHGLLHVRRLSSEFGVYVPWSSIQGCRHTGSSHVGPVQTPRHRRPQCKVKHAKLLFYGQPETNQAPLTIRLRTAKSLRVFDVICNSILGRSSSTPVLRSGHTSYVTSSSQISQEVTYRALALGASYEVSAILDAAVSQSAQGGLDADAAEGFVLSLRRCSRTFPSILRQHHHTNGKPDMRHTTIGNVHVASVYYFSVILVTRQFLIQHVVPQLSGHGDSGPRQNSCSTTNAVDTAKITHLAEACIEAATFMAQMCHQVLKNSLLVGNMCILK